MSRAPGEGRDGGDKQGVRSGSRNWERARLTGREGCTEGEREGNRNQPVGWALARTTFLILQTRKLRPGEGKWFAQGQGLEGIICSLALSSLAHLPFCGEAVLADRLLGSPTRTGVGQP